MLLIQGANGRDRGARLDGQFNLQCGQIDDIQMPVVPTRETFPRLLKNGNFPHVIGMCGDGCGGKVRFLSLVDA